MKPDESNLAIPRDASIVRVRLTAPKAPSWIDHWLADDRGAGRIATHAGEDWAITAAGPRALARVRCRDAARMDARTFERAVTALYGRLAALLREHEAGEPVRFWNYVPDIHGDGGPAGDRYMAFNAGRHRALESWFGADVFQSRLVAASAVDHRGGDLIVHALTDGAPSRPVENPRQRPAYRYSRRYGAIPPSFARAILVEADLAPPALLTAGTASVVGEDSRHADDLSGQLREIEINLAALVAAASPFAGKVAADGDPRLRRGPLGVYRHLRAYVVSASDEPAVVRWMERAFAGVVAVEVMPADLCRRGLLCEVEAVAWLPELEGDPPPFAERA